MRLRPRAKTPEVLFPDLVENLYHRVLDDFIFQRRDPQWPLPPTGFRYPDSSRWLRAVCPAMDTSMEVDQSFLQSVSLFLPRHSVHTRRRLPFQAVIAASEQIDIDMMQQGGEL